MPFTSRALCKKQLRNNLLLSTFLFVTQLSAFASNESYADTEQKNQPTEERADNLADGWSEEFSGEWGEEWMKSGVKKNNHHHGN